jgi:hypothetical protein
LREEAILNKKEEVRMNEIKKIEAKEAPAAVGPYSQGTVVSSGIGESVETETEVGDGVLEGR